MSGSRAETVVGSVKRTLTRLVFHLIKVAALHRFSPTGLTGLNCTNSKRQQLWQMTPQLSTRHKHPPLAGPRGAAGRQRDQQPAELKWRRRQWARTGSFIIHGPKAPTDTTEPLDSQIIHRVEFRVAAARFCSQMSCRSRARLVRAQVHHPGKDGTPDPGCPCEPGRAANRTYRTCGGGSGQIFRFVTGAEANLSPLSLLRRS